MTQATAMLSNFRLGQKCPKVTNTLAYYSNYFNDPKKVFQDCIFEETCCFETSEKVGDNFKVFTYSITEGRKRHCRACTIKLFTAVDNTLMW